MVNTIAPGIPINGMNPKVAMQMAMIIDHFMNACDASSFSYGISKSRNLIEDCF